MHHRPAMGEVGPVKTEMGIDSCLLFGNDDANKSGSQNDDFLVANMLSHRFNESVLVCVGSDTSMHVRVSNADYWVMLQGLDEMETDYKFYCRADAIIANLSSIVMHELVSNFGNLRSVIVEDKRTNAFNGIFDLAPSETIEQFMMYAMIEPLVVVFGLYLVVRLVMTKKFVLTYQNQRRVFFVALMVAEKFVQDEEESYTATSFCTLAQFSFPLYLKLQCLFLDLIDWKLMVSDPLLRSFRAQIINMIRPCIENAFARTS